MTIDHNSAKLLAATTVPTPPITPGPDAQKNKALGPITIGRGVVEDAPAMAAIGGATFAATFGHSVSKEDLETFLTTTYTTEAVTAEFSDPDKAWIVAKSANGNVVGIAQLYRRQTHTSIDADASQVAEMQKVYVDSSAHGQGIGSKLIAAVEQLGRKEGFRKLWLTVWEENVKAQRLYERLSYQRSGEIDFVTGDCVQTDYVLVKSL